MGKATGAVALLTNIEVHFAAPAVDRPGCDVDPAGNALESKPKRSRTGFELSRENEPAERENPRNVARTLAESENSRCSIATWWHEHPRVTTRDAGASVPQELPINRYEKAARSGSARKTDDTVNTIAEGEPFLLFKPPRGSYHRYSWVQRIRECM